MKTENDKLKTDQKDIVELKNLSKRSSDFKTIHITLAGQQLSISYFNTLIDEKSLQSNVILPVQNRVLDSELRRLEDLKAWIPIDDVEISDQVKDIQSKLLKGYAIVELDEHDRKCALVNVANKEGLRKDNQTENEFSVVGPKVGFIENLDTNIRLLRAQINIPNLIVKEITIGSISKTRVAVIYIDGVTNEQFVQTVVMNYFIDDYSRIEWVSELYSTTGFYFIYAYIPFIFFIVQIRKGWRKLRQRKYARPPG